MENFSGVVNSDHSSSRVGNKRPPWPYRYQPTLHFVFLIASCCIMLSGILLLAVGVWSIFHQPVITAMVCSALGSLGSAVITGNGVQLTVAGGCGILGAWNGGYWALAHMGLSGLASAMLLANLFLLSIYQHSLEQVAGNCLQKTLNQALEFQHSSQHSVWDNLQSSLGCCGVNGFTDWCSNNTAPSPNDTGRLMGRSGVYNTSEKTNDDQWTERNKSYTNGEGRTKPQLLQYHRYQVSTTFLDPELLFDGKTNTPVTEKTHMKTDKSHVHTGEEYKEMPTESLDNYKEVKHNISQDVIERTEETQVNNFNETEYNISQDVIERTEGTKVNKFIETAYSISQDVIEHTEVNKFNETAYNISQDVIEHTEETQVNKFHETAYNISQDVIERTEETQVNNFNETAYNIHREDANITGDYNTSNRKYLYTNYLLNMLSKLSKRRDGSDVTKTQEHLNVTEMQCQVPKSCCRILPHNSTLESLCPFVPDLHNTYSTGCLGPLNALIFLCCFIYRSICVGISILSLSSAILAVFIFVVN